MILKSASRCKNVASSKPADDFPLDIFANNLDELDQPVHQLPCSRGQVQPGADHQHRLHDGPGLGLPLSVLRPPNHTDYQASGGLASVQLVLPRPRHTRQRPPPGEDVLASILHQNVIF